VLGKQKIRFEPQRGGTAFGQHHQGQRGIPEISAWKRFAFGKLLIANCCRCDATTTKDTNGWLLLAFGLLLTAICQLLLR
jgi:hypothetical protein